MALALACLALIVSAPLQSPDVPAGAAHDDGPAAVVEPSHLPAPSASAGEPDFLFGRPGFSFTARLGVYAPRARSAFHDFAIDRFTLERDDFRGIAGGVEAGLWLSEHLEVALALDGTGTTVDSEYRDWVEETSQGTLPIRQRTRLAQGPTLSAALKGYPIGRGEGLSRFAWIPHRAAPFVSVGVGATRYDLEQWGDWVIEDTGDIITDEFRSDGAGILAFVGGGVDVTVAPRVALVLDGRYAWGEAEMSRDFFGDFGPIDLSGLRLTAGLAYRF